MITPPSSSQGSWTITADDPVLRQVEDHGALDKILDRSCPTPSLKARSFCHAILDHPCPLSPPQNDPQHSLNVKTGAVLVLLTFDKTTGDPLVTLTTRSMKLRSHPGDTALPGGKKDPTDASFEATALREAYEEVGLDVSCENVAFLSRFQPYPSASFIEVHPCVFIWTGSTPPVFEINEDEVDAIFHADMHSFLSPTIKETEDKTSVIASNNVATTKTTTTTPYIHSYDDLLWISDSLYRLHIFQHADFASDVTGLTAEMLVDIALVGFKVDVKTLTYSRNAEDQLSPAEMMKLIRTGKAQKRESNGGRRSRTTRSFPQ